MARAVPIIGSAIRELNKYDVVRPRKRVGFPKPARANKKAFSPKRTNGPDEKLLRTLHTDTVCRINRIKFAYNL